MSEHFFKSSYIQIPSLANYSGCIRVPGSKSVTNRVLLISALASGTTKLHNLLKSDDTCYMCNALKSLGVNISMSEDCTEATIVGLGSAINSNAKQGAAIDLYLGNAGTAMRSLCAVLTLGNGLFNLSGEERMKERPICDLVDALKSLGANICYTETEGFPPVSIKAHGLKGGKVSVKGNISSQYLTALLICAPYAETPLHIHVDGALVSAPYVLLTLEIMAQFGVKVERTGLTDFYVPNCVYKNVSDYLVEGDASSATYPLAAAAISGGKIRVLGVGKDCGQGDIAFVDVLRGMGATITMGSDWVECEGHTGKLKSLGEFNAVKIPDAAMTIAVLALFADAPMKISGIASWRVKETDRIAAMAAELRKVGAEVREANDYIIVTPPKNLQGATIETYNDHRMAMCFSLVALGGVPIKIMDPGCVAKTYPKYFEDFLTIAK